MLFFLLFPMSTLQQIGEKSRIGFVWKLGGGAWAEGEGRGQRGEKAHTMYGHTSLISFFRVCSSPFRGHSHPLLSLLLGI
jgi:hypothetical protein